MRRLLVVVLLMVAPVLQAAIDVYRFDSAEDEARFRELVTELRCPKCQNQAISDSDADIAQDMRAQVAAMIRDGRSDDEIVDYFVQRYGQFVTYEPPLSMETLVLWFGPLLVMIAGLALLVAQVRRARALPVDDDEETS